MDIRLYNKEIEMDGEDKRILIIEKGGVINATGNTFSKRNNGSIRENLVLARIRMSPPNPLHTVHSFWRLLQALCMLSFIPESHQT